MRSSFFCQMCGEHVPCGHLHDCPQKRIPLEIIEERILDLENRLHQLEEVLTYLLDHQGENTPVRYSLDLQKIRDEVRSALEY